MSKIQQTRALTRVASGLRINSASDDPGGMSVQIRVRNQIRGILQANRNTQSGVSLLQTADTALSEVETMLTRLRELTVQAAEGTITTNDRENIFQDIRQIFSEINSISRETEFSRIPLFGGMNRDYINFISSIFQSGVSGFSPGATVFTGIHDLDSILSNLFPNHGTSGNFTFGNRQDVDNNWLNQIFGPNGIRNDNYTVAQAAARNRTAIMDWLNSATVQANLANSGWTLRADAVTRLGNISDSRLATFANVNTFVNHADFQSLFDSTNNSTFATGVLAHFRDVYGTNLLNVGEIPALNGLSQTTRDAVNLHNRTQIQNFLIAANQAGLPNGLQLRSDWQQRLATNTFHTQASVDNFLNNSTGFRDLFDIQNPGAAGITDVINSLDLQNFSDNRLVQWPGLGGDQAAQLAQYNMIKFREMVQNSGLALSNNFNSVFDSFSNNHFSSATNFQNFLNSSDFMNLFENSVTHNQAINTLGVSNTANAFDNLIANDTFLTPAGGVMPANIDRIRDLNRRQLEQWLNEKGTNRIDGYTINVSNNFFNDPFFTHINIFPIGSTPGILQNAPSGSITNWIQNTANSTGATDFGNMLSWNANNVDIAASLNVPAPFQNILDADTEVNNAHRNVVQNWLSGHMNATTVPGNYLYGWSLNTTPVQTGTDAQGNPITAPSWIANMPWPTIPNFQTEQQVVDWINNQLLIPSREGPIFQFSGQQPANLLNTLGWQSTQVTLENGGFNPRDGAFDAGAHNRQQVINWVNNNVGSLMGSHTGWSFHPNNIPSLYTTGTNGVGGQTAVLDFLNSINFDQVFTQRPPVDEVGRELREPLQISIQRGPNAMQRTTLQINAMNLHELNLQNFAAHFENAVQWNEPERISALLENVDYSINRIASDRALIGSQERRLEHITSNLVNQEIVLQGHLDHVQNTDHARELVNFVRASMQEQSAMFTLTQSMNNMLPLETLMSIMI